MPWKAYTFRCRPSCEIYGSLTQEIETRWEPQNHSSRDKVSDPHGNADLIVERDSAHAAFNQSWGGRMTCG
jgi:hypothetical protein